MGMVGGSIGLIPVLPPVRLAQLERRGPEQDAEDGGRGDRDPDDDPPADMDPEMARRQERSGVRADGVERDIAEVEQPREAHDDVESERQDREGRARDKDRGPWPRDERQRGLERAVPDRIDDRDDQEDRDDRQVASSPVHAGEGVGDGRPRGAHGARHVTLAPTASRP
jgi:hypothetical protein